MNPARTLYESWLFESVEGRLPGWKRLLLERALRRDAALRCLALELLEFECEPATGLAAPDLRPLLRGRVLAEAPVPERPLFPSAWIPAGAIAALLITALVALSVRPSRAPRAESSAQTALLLESALPGPPATAQAQSASVSAPAPLTANAAVHGPASTLSPSSERAASPTPSRPTP